MDPFWWHKFWFRRRNQSHILVYILVHILVCILVCTALACTSSAYNIGFGFILRLPKYLWRIPYLLLKIIQFILMGQFSEQQLIFGFVLVQSSNLILQDQQDFLALTGFLYLPIKKSQPVLKVARAHSGLFSFILYFYNFQIKYPLI